MKKIKNFLNNLKTERQKQGKRSVNFMPMQA